MFNLTLVRHYSYRSCFLDATIDVSLPFTPYPGLRLELTHTGDPEVDDDGGFDEQVTDRLEWDCNTNTFRDYSLWPTKGVLVEDDPEYPCTAEDEKAFLEERGWTVTVTTREQLADVLTSPANPPQ